MNTYSKVVKTTSKNADFRIVENYKPYVGLQNSVCITKSII